VPPSATRSRLPLIFVSWSVKPDYKQDPYAPRIQLLLRWTSENSPYWNDLIMYMSSFAFERPERGGNRMVPTGIRVHPTLNLAMSKGELRLESSDPRAQPIGEKRKRKATSITASPSLSTPNS